MKELDLTRKQVQKDMKELQEKQILKQLKDGIKMGAVITEETKNAVTEKTGETETKADTAVQEETGTSQSQETKEPETETQDARSEEHV